MDWLSEHGFLSWDAVIIVIVAFLITWDGWRRLKKSANKKQQARDEEVKQLARRQRDKKNTRR